MAGLPKTMENLSTLTQSVESKKRPGGLKLQALLTVLFLISTLVFAGYAFLLRSQQHHFKQSALEAQETALAMSRERDQAVSTAEGLRADLVSYDAMAKRLEFEKSRAARAEARLKELGEKESRA